jgi:hypothetical protein
MTLQKATWWRVPITWHEEGLVIVNPQNKGTSLKELEKYVIKKNDEFSAPGVKF